MIRLIKTNKTYITSDNENEPLIRYITLRAAASIQEQMLRVISCSDNLFFRLMDALLYDQKEYKVLNAFYSLSDYKLQKEYVLDVLNNIYEKASSSEAVYMSEIELLLFYLINSLETNNTGYLADLEPAVDELANILECQYHLAKSTSKRLAGRTLLPTLKNIADTETNNMYFRNHDFLAFHIAPTRAVPIINKKEQIDVTIITPKRTRTRKSSPTVPPLSSSSPKDRKKKIHTEKKKEITDEPYQLSLFDLM